MENENNQEAPKRKKTGGRTKGSKNLRTRLVEEQIDKLLKKHKFDPLEAQIVLAEQLRKDMENAANSRDKYKAADLLRAVLADISPVIYAKRKAVEVKADVEHSGRVQFNMVTSGKHDPADALKVLEEEGK
jgi:hypothetical protein